MDAEGSGVSTKNKKIALIENSFLQWTFFYL